MLTSYLVFLSGSFTVGLILKDTKLTICNYCLVMFLFMCIKLCDSTIQLISSIVWPVVFPCLSIFVGYSILSESTVLTVLLSPIYICYL